MGIKKDIAELDNRWKSEYEEYVQEFESKSAELYKSFTEISMAFSGINSERLSLRDQIKYLYDFLSQWKVKDKVTPFQYVDEIPVTYVPIEKVANQHSSKYRDKSEMTRDTVKNVAKTVVLGPIHTIMNHSDLKSDYQHRLEEYEEEKNHWLNCINQCAEKKQFYAVALEIAKLYRAVLMIIRDTVQHIILPELGGITAFLYAEGVKDCVIYDDSPSNAQPVSITEYKGSKAYGQHYTFVQNAHDFYMMIVSYFTTPHLTNLLAQQNLTEQDKKEFNNKINELKQQTELLKNDVIYAEVQQ